jgi:hypothetical protein
MSILSALPPRSTYLILFIKELLACVREGTVATQIEFISLLDSPPTTSLCKMYSQRTEWLTKLIRDIDKYNLESFEQRKRPASSKLSFQCSVNLLLNVPPQLLQNVTVTCNACHSLDILKQSTDFWKVFITAGTSVSELIILAVSVEIALMAVESPLINVDLRNF